MNPPTPVGDLKWVNEHTSMRKCGESKVQGNVVTMVCLIFYHFPVYLLYVCCEGIMHVSRVMNDEMEW